MSLFARRIPYTPPMAFRPDLRSLHRPPFRLFLIALTFLTGTFPSGAEAQVGISMTRVGDSPIRVDGMLREWRGVRRVRLGGGSDASARVGLAYDDRGIYVAASVQDERIVRTGGLAPIQDAIVLTFAMPGRRGRFAPSEFFLFPGISRQATAAAGMSSAIGASRLRPVRGAEVVEASARGGYELEAFIPWSQIPGARAWERGGRLAVRLRDVDRETRPSVESEPATVAVDPRALERMPEIQASSGTSAVIRSFLEEHDLGPRAAHDLRGNICGDERPERVAHHGRYILALGPGYRDANAYDFLQLPIQNESDVLDMELRDLTGDGQQELVARLRQRDSRGSRVLWQVYRFDCQRIQPAFAIEVEKETRAGQVSARLQVRRARRGAPQIVVSTGRARGLNAENYQEAQATDARPILTPWGEHRSETYRWDGRRFALASSSDNPRYVSPEARAQAQSESRREQSRREESRREERAARPVNSRELIARVRQERNIPRSVRPRFRAERNIAEGPEAEVMVVLGSALVIVGPGFRNGQGYFLYDLGVSAEDILSVQAVDLTGDGRAEVLVRVRQNLGEVTREVLLVHRFARGGRFPRVLAAEVARTSGNRSLNARIQTRGGLTISPGRARGFNQSSWPWNDPRVAQGIETIPLPWRDSPRRYRLQGDQLRAQ